MEYNEVTYNKMKKNVDKLFKKMQKANSKIEEPDSPKYKSSYRFADECRKEYSLAWAKMYKYEQLNRLK
jgi:hypothetical protein